jgi:hypothetical protein
LSCESKSNKHGEIANKSIARLFFSSLAASDLELAHQAISNEQAARAQERMLAFRSQLEEAH